MLPDVSELSSQAPINPLYSFNPFGGLPTVMPAQQGDLLPPLFILIDRFYQDHLRVSIHR
jgi:hypothetical protein